MTRRPGRHSGPARPERQPVRPALARRSDDEEAGAGDARLARLLEGPPLAEVVPRLAPEAIHRLIRDCGLHACAPLLSAATTTQLASLLDLDLWHRDPTRDDRFDECRFGEWLEVLSDEGPDAAARVLAAMDRDVAIAGLAAHVRVFDPGVLPCAGDDAPAAAIEHDVGGYVVRPRAASAPWDAIVAVLVALADADADGFYSLMRGCRRLSNSTPEVDELDDLLHAPAQQRYDIAAARDNRRTGQGYLAAADARAFLHLARQPHARATIAGMAALVTACFRGLDEAAAVPDIAAPIDTPGVADDVASNPPASSAPARLALTGRTDPAGAAPGLPIEPILASLGAFDRAAAFARQRELAFLVNALITGTPVQDRACTPIEARHIALGVCNLGLERRAPRTQGPASLLPPDFFATHDLVTTFAAGWRVLHDEVARHVAARLHLITGRLRSGDLAVQRDLLALHRHLGRALEADAPWTARGALDVIAMLDAPIWSCLCALTAECPVVPAALAAVLAGDARPVSATAFEPFSHAAQLRMVRTFTDRLEALLLGT